MVSGEKQKRRSMLVTNSEKKDKFYSMIKSMTKVKMRRDGSKRKSYVETSKRPNSVLEVESK